MPTLLCFQRELNEGAVEQIEFSSAYTSARIAAQREVVGL